MRRRQGKRAYLKHAAGSRLRKARRAGGPSRNREEKVQLKRLSGMPEGRRAGDLTQEVWASRLSSNVEPLQVAKNLGVLSDPAKDRASESTQTGVAALPELPSRSTERFESRAVRKSLWEPRGEWPIRASEKAPGVRHREPSAKAKPSGPHREAREPGALSGPKVRRKSKIATGVVCRPQHTRVSRPRTEMRPDIRTLEP
jgi:hypothetical protein